MATVTLHPDPQLFPPGQAVKVFKVPAGAPVGYKPTGAALSEPTVESSGALVVTGVTVGERYVAETGSGESRKTLYFSGGEASSGGGGEGISKAEAETLASAAESGAISAATSKDSSAKTTTLSEAATAAAGKDATLKGEAESKDTAAIAAAEAGAKTAGDAAYRKAGTAITPNTPQTWAVATVEVGTLLGEPRVLPGTGDTLKALAVDYKITGGTKATFKLQKNGEDLAGFTGLEAKKENGHKAPTAVALAEGDVLSVVVTAVEGSPKNLSVTLHTAHSV